MPDAQDALTISQLRKRAFALIEQANSRWDLDKYPDERGMPKFTPESRALLVAEAQVYATLALTAPPM